MRSRRPPVPGVRYRAFVDPSGGSADSMTLAIAHKDGDERVLDSLREVRPPVLSRGCRRRVCDHLEVVSGLVRCAGDRYGGEFCREVFRQHGIKYEPAAKPKSDLYRDALPLLNSRRVALLDHARLVNQLVRPRATHRRAAGATASITHPEDTTTSLTQPAARWSSWERAPTCTLDNVCAPGDPPFRWTLGQRLLGVG